MVRISRSEVKTLITIGGLSEKGKSVEYQVQQQDIEFLLDDVFDVQSAWSEIEAFADLSPDVVKAIVAEGGRVAAEVMAPLNQSGDAEGCQWQDGEVTTPTGFAAAFAELAQGGWLGLSGNPQFGGQGMPKSLGCLVEEMFLVGEQQPLFVRHADWGHAYV